MDTLFGKKIISSISFSEEEILKDILELHCPHGIDLDPCYSIGSFYERSGISRPKYRFDIEPSIGGVTKANANNLPLPDSSIKSVMFDPPFVIGGQTYKDAKDGSCITAKRFTNFDSWQQLKDMYLSSMVDIYRVLDINGVLIFKCQDTVSSGKQHITHVWVMNVAIEIGFYPKDLFILLSKNRLIGAHETQQHARKFHCYYWVFIKQKCPIDYKIQKHYEQR